MFNQNAVDRLIENIIKIIFKFSILFYVCLCIFLESFFYHGIVLNCEGKSLCFSILEVSSLGGLPTIN